MSISLQAKQEILRKVQKLIDAIPEKARIALAKASRDGTGVVDLELLSYPQRYVNNLEENGINTIEELLNKKPAELLELKQFGSNALLDLYKCLSNFHKLEAISAILENKVVIKKKSR